jgi:anti-sigma factor RsiW
MDTTAVALQRKPWSADEAIRMSSVPNSPDRCPSDIDETAEAYIMERLSPADALQFEYHCYACRRCAAAAEEADSYVRAIRGAAQRWVVEPRGRPRPSSPVPVNPEPGTRQ